MKCAETTGFRTKALIEYFRQVPDHRSSRKKKHDHAEMLVCITVGFICGRTTIRRSLNWCKKHIDWLRQYMPLENGIASPSTISRMLGGLDEELFLYAFMEWIGEIADSRNTHLAIDGKALRGATQKVQTFKSPMVMNVIEAIKGLVLAQVPIENKGCEITAIPEVLKLLDIRGSTVTIDAVGTQAGIMEQIHKQGGNFILTVKENQPEACVEINCFMDKLENEAGKERKGEKTDSGLKDYLAKYEEVSKTEKNRDRYEYRTYKICNDASELTKSQKEWKHVKSIGQVKQVRAPVEKDREGNDITPSREEFLRKGSRRAPVSAAAVGRGKNIQCSAMISDRFLTAEELGRIKRMHWSIENRLHHVLDDTFREDRSPAKKSRNNLALIRKYAYNILRLAMLATEGNGIMTEMMDCFCDNAALREKYIFKGITSLY